MLPTRPNIWLSTLVVLGLTTLWGLIRLVWFREDVLPLTFVLPMLVCVWTGYRWQLWSMATAFSCMAVAKAILLTSSQQLVVSEGVLFASATLANIWIGAGLILFILHTKEALEIKNATISAQNAELEAQTEELSQQNEEIRSQTEELAEQNEEIESQSEEALRQNEELLHLNARVGSREEILQGLLEACKEISGTPAMLKQLLAKSLDALDEPAEAMAILQSHGDHLFRICFTGEEGAIPEIWPIDGTLAGIVLKEGKTAYVEDLNLRRDIAQPFVDEIPFPSILATPVSLGPEKRGIVVALSEESAHWSDEQFRIIEWIAAQCGLILEILNTQEALSKQTEVLQEAMKFKDNFIAMLSHELRTPLTPVLAASEELLRDPSLTTSVREDMQMISRNVAVQSRLIDDLLDLTRISRGKLELIREDLNAEELIRDVVAIIAPDLDANSQHLDLEITGLGHCALNGDRARLQQIFWNLLKNAIKFSPQGSRISLSATAHEDRLIISIADSGCGISSEDLEKIFLPFEQAANRAKSIRHGGLGLGLAIANSLIKLHDGFITARSDGPETGTTFTVNLPTVKRTIDFPLGTMEQSEIPKHTAAATMKERSILLVEDHADTGKIISRILKGLGHQVEHVQSAAEAKAAFSLGEHELVISDIGLPDENGFELMQQLRAMKSNFRAISMSGYGTERDMESSRSAGFDVHLTKPVNINTLKSTVERLTGTDTIKIA